MRYVIFTRTLGSFAQHHIRVPTVDKYARGDARWQEVTGLVGSEESRSREVTKICRGVAFAVNERDSAISISVSAGYIIEFMLEDLEAVPADYVPAGHVLISADRYRIC
ncbi:hypothetical protein Tco_0801428 [Tanacetum coccineum]|uniref:Uncharacterized protein n=1 Tax=Tanacetum coccineum TaxID=301880 RepID=A0ABQ4ZWV0_9ASTR